MKDPLEHAKKRIDDQEVAETLNTGNLELDGLDLTSDNLRDLIPYIKKKYPNLISLNLNGNKLTYLPLEIGQLTELMNLSLVNNELQKLPKEIGLLQNLFTLNLQNNKLQELPEEIGLLRNLITLNLQNNELQKLPKEIGQLTELMNLSLVNNELQKLPKEIGLLQNLFTLNLQNNKLQELPEEILKFIGLKTLNLGDTIFDKLIGVWQKSINRIQDIDPKSEAERVIENEKKAFLEKFKKVYDYVGEIDSRASSDKDEAVRDLAYIDNKKFIYDNSIMRYKKAIEKMYNIYFAIENAAADLPNSQLFYSMIDENIQSLEEEIKQYEPTEFLVSNTTAKLSGENRKKEIRERLDDLYKLRKGYGELTVKQKEIEVQVDYAEDRILEYTKKRFDLDLIYDAHADELIRSWRNEVDNILKVDVEGELEKITELRTNEFLRKRGELEEEYRNDPDRSPENRVRRDKKFLKAVRLLPHKTSMKYDEKIIRQMESYGALIAKAYNKLPEPQLLERIIGGKIKSLKEEKKENGPGEEGRQEEIDKQLEDLVELRKHLFRIGQTVGLKEGSIKDAVTDAERDMEENMSELHGELGDSAVGSISEWQRDRLISVWQNRINDIYPDADRELEEFLSDGKAVLEREKEKFFKNYRNDPDLSPEDKKVLEANKLMDEGILVKEFNIDLNKNGIIGIKKYKKSIKEAYEALPERQLFDRTIQEKIRILKKIKENEPGEEGKIDKQLEDLDTLLEDFGEIGEATVAEKQVEIDNIVRNAETHIGIFSEQLSQVPEIDDWVFNTLLKGMETIRNIDPESEFKDIIGYGENLSEEEEQLLKVYENNDFVFPEAAGAELAKKIIKAKQSKLENTILNYRLFIEKMKPYSESIDKALEVLSREHYFDRILENKINILNGNKGKGAGEGLAEVGGRTQNEIEGRIIEYLSTLLADHRMESHNASTNKEKIDGLVKHSKEMIAKLNQERSNLSSKEILIDPSKGVSIPYPDAYELIGAWQKRINNIQHVDPEYEAFRIQQNGWLSVIDKNHVFFGYLKNKIDLYENDMAIYLYENETALDPIYINGTAVLFEDLVGIEEKVIEKMNRSSSSIEHVFNGLPDSSVFYSTIDNEINSLEEKIEELLPTKLWFYYLRPQSRRENLRKENLRKENLKEKLNGRRGALNKLRKDYGEILATVAVKQQIIKDQVGKANSRLKGLCETRDDLRDKVLIRNWQENIRKIQGIDPMQEALRIIENEDLKFSEEFGELKTFIDRIEPIFDEKVGQEEGNVFLQAKNVQLSSKIVGYTKVIKKMEELSSSIDDAYNGLPDSSVFYATREKGINSLEEKINEIVPTKSWFYYLRPQLWRENSKKKNLKEELYGRLGDLDELGKYYLNITEGADTKKRLIGEEIIKANIEIGLCKNAWDDWCNIGKTESEASEDIQIDNDADDIIEVSSTPYQTMSAPPAVPPKIRKDANEMDTPSARPDDTEAVVADMDVPASKEDNGVRPLPPLPGNGNDTDPSVGKVVIMGKVDQNAIEGLNNDFNSLKAPKANGKDTGDWELKNYETFAQFLKVYNSDLAKCSGYLKEFGFQDADIKVLGEYARLLIASKGGEDQGAFERYQKTLIEGFEEEIDLLYAQHSAAGSLKGGASSHDEKSLEGIFKLQILIDGKIGRAREMVKNLEKLKDNVRIEGVDPVIWDRVYNLVETVAEGRVELINDASDRLAELIAGLGNPVVYNLYAGPKMTRIIDKKLRKSFNAVRKDRVMFRNRTEHLGMPIQEGYFGMRPLVIKMENKLRAYTYHKPFVYNKKTKADYDACRALLISEILPKLTKKYADPFESQETLGIIDGLLDKAGDHLDRKALGMLKDIFFRTQVKISGDKMKKDLSAFRKRDGGSFLKSVFGKSRPGQMELESGFAQIKSYGDWEYNKLCSGDSETWRRFLANFEQIKEVSNAATDEFLKNFDNARYFMGDEKLGAIFKVLGRNDSPRSFIEGFTRDGGIAVPEEGDIMNVTAATDMAAGRSVSGDISKGAAEGQDNSVADTLAKAQGTGAINGTQQRPVTEEETAERVRSADENEVLTTTGNPAGAESAEGLQSLTPPVEIKGEGTPLGDDQQSPVLPPRPQTTNGDQEDAQLDLSQLTTPLNEDKKTSGNEKNNGTNPRANIGARQKSRSSMGV